MLYNDEATEKFTIISCDSKARISHEKSGVKYIEFNNNYNLSIALKTLFTPTVPFYANRSSLDGLEFMN